MTGRWIRLDTGWASSGWIAELPPASRLCWPELLCYTKAHGIAGRVKALNPGVAARLWGVTRDDVTLLVTAAKADGALEEEAGEWVITGWQEYQGDPTAKDRSKRYRQRQQEDTGFSTDGTVTPVTRDDTPVTPTVTVTRTKTETGTTPLPPSTALASPNGHLQPNELLAAWIDLQGIPPDAREKAKQAGKAKQICAAHSREDIVAAFIGIGQLYPYSDGTPWDLFDLERKFTKAKQAALKHPELEAKRREAEIMRELTAP